MTMQAWAFNEDQLRSALQAWIVRQDSMAASMRTMLSDSTIDFLKSPEASKLRVQAFVPLTTKVALNPAAAWPFPEEFTK